MEKVFIITNAYIKNKSQLEQAKRIRDELIALGADCKIVKNLNLCEIAGGKTKTKISSPCIFLDKDKVCARLLEKSGVKLFNSASAIEVCDDKMLTYAALANGNILMPDTVFAPLCYYAEAQPLSELINAVSALNFPVVAKHNYGSMGKGVFLLENREEVIEFEKKNKLVPHFYQKFTGIKGEDIRAIVLGGKFVCAMRRKNESDFRSNIALGGKGEKYNADGEFISLCERVANILKLDYCGIDILFDEQGNKYICEVNSNAFFSEIERVCFINVAKIYAEYVLKNIQP